ncbi:extracellular solute-binding protein [Paenibacillus sp. YYML68]|uniref:extracellular solute-binding protein n=1 Tax=Paenibacillus sp. YYML68 TaxID=2909250 RepID=UPI00248FABFA|nr:extracellular solute-binding protein [Paenibacillus sp. YYML68]
MTILNNNKKLLPLTVALAMTFTTAACTSPSGSEPKEGQSTDKPKQDAVQVDPNSPGWKADTSPITFDWYLNFSWFPNKWGVDATSQYVTKKTGVNINFIVPAGNENEKLNTMIASGKLPDLITLGWWEDAVKKMVEGGLVLPLDELAKQYDPYFIKVADPAKVSWFSQPDGHLYGYPNASASPKDYEKYGENFVGNQTLVVRKDMYEALGKPDLRTPEGFLDALKAAKQKFPEVNGQPLIPIGFHEFTDTGNASFSDNQQYSSMLQNFLAIPMEKDGKMYDRETDPEYIRWLKTFRKANELGLIAKDVFIDKRSQMEEKAAQGRYFAMFYQRTDFAAAQNALYAKDPNSVYIAVDGPANAKLDPPTIPGPGISGWTVTLISKDVKDKARAIRFLSYLMSEEGVKDLYLGEKGVSWDTIDGKDTFKPEVWELMNKDRNAFDKKYGSSWTFWMLMDNNMQLQWQKPTPEPFKQLEDWTKGKLKNFSPYDQTVPSGTGAEGLAASKIAQVWGKALPKLLLAKSDAEFDQLFDKYVKDREAAGFAKMMEYRNKAYGENKKKLEQFMK